MLKKRDKRIITAAVALVLLSQPVIIASIPRGSDSTIIAVVIKKGTHLRDAGYLLEEEGLNEVRLHRLGYPDSYIEQGEQPELRAMYGLDAAGIAVTVRTALEK